MSASSQSSLAQGYSELESKLELEQDKNLKLEEQCLIIQNEKEDLRQKVGFLYQK